MATYPTRTLKLDPCPTPITLVTKPLALEPPQVASDPATLAMTDFQEYDVVTVHKSRPIDGALQDMMYRGVRALFVTDDSNNVTGLVSSYDIQGEKPLRFLQSAARAHDIQGRNDILTAHIMTPLSDLRVLSIEEINNATLGDLVNSFEEFCLTHIVVVDKPRDTWRIRGIVSAARLQRILGIRIDSICAAFNFADLERAISH